MKVKELLFLVNSFDTPVVIEDRNKRLALVEKGKYKKYNLKKEVGMLLGYTLTDIKTNYEKIKINKMEIKNIMVADSILFVEVR